MAIRNIVKDGDEILGKTAREVTTFDKKLWILLDDMTETMKSANGQGLAATQVGLLKSAAVVFVDDKLYELVNPVILETSGEIIDTEGCLSVPGVWGKVPRPAWVKVAYKNRKGKEQIIEAEGLLARAFCHEIGHLHGELFTKYVVEFIELEE